MIAAGERCITLKEVEHITSVRKPTIYRLIRAGRFPAQIQVSGNRVGWLASEIQDWIEARVEERNQWRNR